MKKFKTILASTLFIIGLAPISASADNWPDWIDRVEFFNLVDDKSVVEISNQRNRQYKATDLDRNKSKMGVQDFWDQYFDTMYNNKRIEKESSSLNTEGFGFFQEADSIVIDFDNWPLWIDKPEGMYYLGD